jgi:hypothetical protein
MLSLHVTFRRAATVSFLLCGLLCGCRNTPSAPSLRDAPVYHSAEEGFRFLVPDGWTQNASAVLPAGKLEGENFLVRYQMKTPEQGATLQIVCAQDSESLDLEKHHAGPSYGVAQWQLAEPAESIQVNEVPADRLVYTAASRGQSMTKEVVCFRKNERVYAFVGLFQSKDDKAREQVRRAVGSVIWED